MPLLKTVKCLMSRLSFLMLIALVGCFAIVPESLHAKTKEAAPFKMQLLRGYHIEPSPYCVDTRCGEIKKWLAPNVQYDMGGDLWQGTRTIKPVDDWKRECSWREDAHSTKSTGTGDVDCYIDDLTDGKHLSVTFPDGTRFYVRTKNQKEGQRFLKMFLTYDPRVEH